MQKIKDMLAGERPLTWLFYGDSITHGFMHVNGFRDYTELFAERVKGEMFRRQDVIINTAISGNTTRQLIESFESRVTRFRPDAAFLMIGMNDSADKHNLDINEYSSNLDTLISNFQNIGTELILQTSQPIIEGQAADREDAYPKYMKVVREKSKLHDLYLIDHYNYWLEQDQWIRWMNNAYHPNEYGHRVMANYIFTKLDINDNEKQTCRLYYPC
ncbi:MAG: SGNH/GDSL hydrolase family protein [Planctomycetota bacterium]|jgi:lysophospholipase L1-like esterase